MSNLNEDFLEYFSSRLVELRFAKNVSARKMSLDIGQSKGYIAQIERKESLPSMTVFFYICEYLNISPKDFFDDGIKQPERIKLILQNLNMLNDEQLDNVAGVVRAIAKK